MTAPWNVASGDEGFSGRKLAGGWIRPHRGYASPGAVRQTGASKVGGNRKPKRLRCLHLRSKRLQRLKPDVKICRHEREVNQKERLAHHACARKNLFETFRKEVLTVMSDYPSSPTWSALGHAIWLRPIPPAYVPR